MNHTEIQERKQQQRPAVKYCGDLQCCGNAQVLKYIVLFWLEVHGYNLVISLHLTPMDLSLQSIKTTVHFAWAHLQSVLQNKKNPQPLSYGNTQQSH